MKKEKIDIWITWFGRILVLVSLVFLLLKLLEYKDDLTGVSYSLRIWVTVGALSLIYGFLKFIPAYGWYKLLLCLPNKSKKLNSISAVIIYGKTHIAKYIPGNIFHYTGRHFLSKKLNLTDSFLIRTTILEVLIVATISATLSLFAFQEIINHIELYLPFLNTYIWGLLIFVTSLIFLFISIKYGGLIREKFYKLKIVPFFKSYMLYLLFFVLNFLVFYIILFFEVAELDHLHENIFYILGSYSLAWFIGFIVPGAPGGIGVREAILFAILNPLIIGGKLLIVLFLFRLITTIGDLLHYCYTVGLEYSLKDHKQY